MERGALLRAHGGDEIVEFGEPLPNAFLGVVGGEIRRTRRTHLDPGDDRRGRLRHPECAERALAAARKDAVQPALDLFRQRDVAALPRRVDRNARGDGEDVDLTAVRAEQPSRQVRAERLQVDRAPGQRVGDLLQMLQVGLDLFHAGHVLELGDAPEERRRHVELRERRIVVDADREQIRLGDGAKVLERLVFSDLPVVRCDDDRAVVAELRGGARPAQCLQRRRARRHRIRGLAGMLARLVEHDVQDAQTLVVLEMEELADRTGRDDPGRALREAPVDLCAQRALVDGIAAVHRRDDQRDDVLEAIPIAFDLHGTSERSSVTFRSGRLWASRRALRAGSLMHSLARRRPARPESPTMVRPGLAAAVAALLGIAPLGAGAIEMSRPLRTLTYAVDVKVVNTMDTPGGTVAGGGTRPALVVKGRVIGQSRGVTGSGDQRYGASLATKGSITVDVVRATDDAGLAVDVAEDAVDRG